jgi:hypothetical protein
MPSTDNPFVAVAYVVGIVLGLPTLNLVIKATTFVVRSTGKLDAVAEKLGELAKSQSSLANDFRDFRQDQLADAQSVELSLAIIENDVNALQRKSDLPVRTYPDRRTGPGDRRQA